MTLKIEELRKQGLNNLAELLEAKGDNPFAKKDDEDEDDSADETPSKDAKLPDLDKAKDDESDAEDDDEDDSEDKDEKKPNPFAKKDKEIEESLMTSFDGIEGLTEEFKSGISEVFIKAVNERAEERTAQLEKYVETTLAEQAADQESSIDSYLTYIGEQWLEENKEAVESKLQTKITESFMVGLRDLFVAHNIDIPADKVDLVESTQAELLETQTTLKQVIAQLQEAKAALVINEKITIVDVACVGLSEMEVDKLHVAAKEFLNEDVETFAAKVAAIKESFVVPEVTSDKVVAPVSEAAKVDVPASEEVITESADASVAKPVDAKMNSYISALGAGNRV